MRKHAKAYLDQGMVPIPVGYKDKKPTTLGWQKQLLETANVERDFIEPCNVGILLGRPSGNLVDIDIDCREALVIADRFLPETKMMFGRQSSPKSHWVYRVSDCGGREPFAGPGNEGMLLEYRGDGAQTVFPPSVHETGEVITFDSDREPATVSKYELMVAVGKLAAAALIAKHWAGGIRHQLSLDLSGGLIRAGWLNEEVRSFVQAVCLAAGDDDVTDRLRAVEDTSKQLSLGDEVSGWPSLSSQIGSPVVAKVLEWLGISMLPGIGHNSRASNDNDLRCSDIGNAEVFVEQHRDSVRYIFDIGSWCIWNGRRWVMDDSQSLEQKAEATVRSFLIEAAGIDDSRERESLMKWIKQSGNRQRISGMLEQAKSHIGIISDELDANPWLLNCDGNVVDLKTGKHCPNRREDLCTKSVNTRYDPDADCPKFKVFLDRITNGSVELQSFIQRAVGYSLTGRTDEQCLFIGHGVGANGKSTLLNTLADLLGDYSMNVSVQTLIAKKFGGGIPNDIARLRGARLVTANEPEANEKLAEGLVKQITGGDKMTARFLHKEHFEFDPVCKLWLVTNHKPQMSGDDQALWRRIHLIPFLVVIPVEERDGGLPELLKTEYPGILKWAVDGCLGWQEKGLSPPDEVAAATSAYQNEMDTIGRFCAEEIIPSPGNKLAKVDLYHGYCKWAEDEGQELLGKGDLTKRIRKLDYKEGRDGTGRYWKDIDIEGVPTTLAF